MEKTLEHRLNHKDPVAQSDHARQTVLVVDDDLPLRRAIVAALENSYNVLSACSGRQAIEILGHNDVDALLLDLVMTDGDGCSVLAYVRSLNPRPAVIMHSVVERVDDVVKMMQLGACDYIRKPTSLSQLRTALDRAMQEA